MALNLMSLCLCKSQNVIIYGLEEFNRILSSFKKLDIHGSYCSMFKNLMYSFYLRYIYKNIIRKVIAICIHNLWSKNKKEVGEVLPPPHIPLISYDVWLYTMLELIKI